MSSDLPVSSKSNGLTAREREILKHIASGLTSKEISVKLGVAFRTVVCHRYRIQTKLGGANTANLTRTAIRNGPD